MIAPPDFKPLTDYMEKLPAIHLPNDQTSISHGLFHNSNWWIKFALDTTHPLAWRHVQELGHVLNYISIESRLPTIFMPVSPPPYMNGGVEFLSWVIESTEPTFTPAKCAEWLEGRLPNPVDDLKKWEINDDVDDSK